MKLIKRKLNQFLFQSKSFVVIFIVHMLFEHCRKLPLTVFLSNMKDIQAQHCTFVLGYCRHPLVLFQLRKYSQQLLDVTRIWIHINKLLFISIRLMVYRNIEEENRLHFVSRRKLIIAYAMIRQTECKIVLPLEAY